MLRHLTVSKFTELAKVKECVVSNKGSLLGNECFEKCQGLAIEWCCQCRCPYRICFAPGQRNHRHISRITESKVYFWSTARPARFSFKVDGNNFCVQASPQPFGISLNFLLN